MLQYYQYLNLALKLGFIFLLNIPVTLNKLNKLSSNFKTGQFETFFYENIFQTSFNFLVLYSHINFVQPKKSL